ncbi:O-antigen ligase family protein [Curtobacterium sp. HSID17257]|uniref:O-antigen ligase family protein n=1 Tax=Curtobacterium sp. HSID17257 TaxID=2419510 RepID=UPI000F86C5B0|nr:O-antigen ligase family protein [Curtobacterium sp. HSID17257]
MNSGADGWGLIVVAIGATVGLVFVSLTTGLRSALFLLLLVALVAFFNRRFVLKAVVVLIPFMPLVRRLVADGGSGDVDPLSIAMLAASTLVLVASMRDGLRSRDGLRGLNLLVLLVVLSVALSFGASGGVTADAIFSAASVCVCLLLVATIAAGVVPDVWAAAEKALPVLGVLSGAYGLFQFYYLPSWDKSWMLASGLRSIGQAIPMQVRIFGPSEAPGPYAFLLGLCATIAVAKALSVGGPRRFVFAGVAIFLLFPMLVSGVRTAILAVAIAIGALLIFRARGFARVVPLLFLGVMFFALSYVQGRLSATSTLFAGSRYTGFDASTDTSFRERLALLEMLRNPGAYLVGRPAGGRYDNIVVDVLVNFGLVAAIGLVLALTLSAVAAIANLRKGVGETGAVATVFALVTAASGNIFLSGYGILIALAFGSTLLQWSARRRSLQVPVESEQRRGSERHALEATDG